MYLLWLSMVLGEFVHEEEGSVVALLAQVVNDLVVSELRECSSAKRDRRWRSRYESSQCSPRHTSAEVFYIICSVQSI